MLAQLLPLLVRSLPKRVAFGLTKLAAEAPPRHSIRRQGIKLLPTPTTFEFGETTRKIGWVTGEGPLVILVHGWAGSSSQLASLAQTLVDDGFRIAAFDVTGHGASPGRRTSFEQFIADIAEFVEHMAPEQQVYAFVTHSAGGLLTMAARRRFNVHAARYVFLNTPRAPYPATNTIRAILNPRPAVMRLAESYYAASLGSSWEELDLGHMFRATDDSPLLLVHDDDDPQIENTDGEVIASVWPGAIIHKTSGLGHHAILRKKECSTLISQFLKV